MAEAFLPRDHPVRQIPASVDRHSAQHGRVHMATAEAQIEFNSVAQKVGVIAIAGNDANAVAPALKCAAKEGIHVISYDSGVATEARQIFVNQVKGESLAEMMLISMHDLIGGEGEFAILSSTATNQNAWIDFMKAKMASEPKFAKMKLVQVAYGEESEQVNQQQALVQAFPNLKGIIVPAGIGLPAAAPPSSRLARSPK
jgi:rhamnose transport system substrate-binding protein